MLVVDLASEFLDLVLEDLSDLLLFLETLRVVAHLLGVEGGRQRGASLFYHRVNGRGGHCRGLWVAFARWLPRRSSHFGEELTLTVIVEQLIWSQDAIILVGVGHIGHVSGAVVKRIVHGTLGTEQLFVDLGRRNRLRNIDWHLESIPNMLASRQPS